MKNLFCLIVAGALLGAFSTNAQDDSIQITNSDLKIPSNWRLVTVVKDREVAGLIGYTLWFQDPSGSVHAISTSRDLMGKYKITPEITVFSSTTNSTAQLSPK